MSRVKIFVTYHNDNYPIFKNEVFEPIYCGLDLYDGKTSLLGDNTGDNISKKNRMYCENTAHYWVWKNYLDNADEDYIGFCHYRRFLDLSKISASEEVGMYVLKYENLRYIFDRFSGDYYDNMKGFDCIVPARDFYYEGGITTPNNKNLPHITCIEELNITRKPDVLDAMITSIETLTPEFVPAMTRVFLKEYAHLYNIYILKKDHLKEYLEWKFKIFAEIEKKTNYWNNGLYKREAGYFAEKFINIWIEYKKEKDPSFKVGYCPVYTYDIVKESIERFKLFNSLGRFDLETDVMEYLTKLIPEQASLYRILSQAYARQNLYDKAYNTLLKFTELNPDEDVSAELERLMNLR